MYKNLLLVFILILSFVPNVPAQPLKIQLTEKEQAFLQSHPLIRFGTDETRKPYVSKNSNGELEGLDIDFILYINETTGANIQLVTGQWREIVEKAKSREIDGLATSAPLEARKLFFAFSQTYVSEYPIVVIPSESQINIQTIKDLSGKRIALQEGNEFYASIINPHPTIKAIEAPDERDSIKIMLEGKADASFSSTSTYYDHQKHFLKSIKIGHVVTETPLEVVYSIRKDWPELVSIINKSLVAMPTATYNTIYQKWFWVTSQENSLKETEYSIHLQV
ncbi:MAG: transporter substrate-binding domain-containing protein [SAR324 cluster bacterium]|nr:transporter substrate-binding domain-containing protein [SAR324 cluster bacterium]